MSEAQKKYVEYLVEAGNIDRIDEAGNRETVAKYDEDNGIVELLPDKRNYRVAIVRHLNDKGYYYKTCGKIGMDVTDAGIPPKPKKSRIQGEKTPGVVEWYAQYKREEFLARYGVRELQVRIGIDEKITRARDKRSGEVVETVHRVPVYRSVTNLDYDLNKLLSGEQRLLADCQTHITTKHRASEAHGEYDDDLDAQIMAEAEQKRKGGHL